MDVGGYRSSSLWLLSPLGWWSLVLEEIRLRNPWGVSQSGALIHSLCSCFCLQLPALESSVMVLWVIWWNEPFPSQVTFGHPVLSQQYKPQLRYTRKKPWKSKCCPFGKQEIQTLWPFIITVWVIPPNLIHVSPSPIFPMHASVLHHLLHACLPFSICPMHASALFHLLHACLPFCLPHACACPLPSAACMPLLPHLHNRYNNSTRILSLSPEWIRSLLQSTDAAAHKNSLLHGRASQL